VIKSGSIVIALHPKNGEYHRWTVAAKHDRWSFITGYPTVPSQEPLMIETSVLLKNCRLAEKHEVDALVVAATAKKESAA
jgi:hypothetical protein